MSKLNQYNDNILAEKEKITKPLLQALKHERTRWKPLETMYEVAISQIRAKMTSYQTELVNTVRETKEAIASRIAPGKGHYSLETAVSKIEGISTPEKEVATTSGLVQFREKKQLKITDVSLIPNEYWQINEEMILEDLKKDIIISGAEIEIVQVPVNYR